MRTRKNLFKASTIVGYVVTFIYLLLTACLFSVRNNLYWLTLVLTVITLVSALWNSELNAKIEKAEDIKKHQVCLWVNTGLQIVNITSGILNLIAMLWNKEDKYIEVVNPDFKPVEKEKKPKKWFQKANFILTCIGFGGIILGSLGGNISETSAYSVEVIDDTLTKAMTDEFNVGEENAINGKNYFIKNEDHSYAFTEYRPKEASAENPLPMVIVMPGFTRTKATMTQYAIEFSRRGAVVFTLDPGCQGGTTYAGYETNEDGTQGGQIGATVSCNGLDYLLQYVYNNTERYSYIDRNKIGAIGHSAGGGNVCNLAQNFAGNSYEESIIKACYISGYIKVSAANRFKSLRCNAAMSYAYYDEGAYRYQGPTSAFEVISLRFINEINGKVLDHKQAIMDYEYGSMAEGTYRVIHQEPVNHCFQMYDPTSIANSINFFRRTLDLDTQIEDSNQVWFAKDICNGIALVCSFIFIFALLGFMIDMVPWFKSFKKASAEKLAVEEEIKLSYRPEGGKKKTVADKLLFWLPLLLTAIVACVDFIPLARLTMDWLPDAASNTYTFTFPARMMNAVMFWAVANGAFGLILFFGVKSVENLVYYLTKQKDKISWYKFNSLRIHWLDLLKSIGIAIVFFFLFYFVLQIMYWCFHQDFRFLLISASPLNGRFLVTWLIYLVPFFVFYISNSIRVNNSIALEGWSEWKVNIVAGLANSLGLVFILVVNYYAYFTTGTVHYGYYSATDTSEMWLYINMVFGLIPMMFLLPIVNRYCYKKSGNVYLGAMLNCMLFIMMSLSASVSYIPM